MSLDKTKPVATRDGQAARIIDVWDGYRGPSGETVLALIKTAIGDQIRGFYENGQFFKSHASEWDLVNVEPPPQQHKVRYHFYVFNDGSMGMSRTCPDYASDDSIIAYAEAEVTFHESGKISELDRITLIQSINRQ